MPTCRLPTLRDLSVIDCSRRQSWLIVVFLLVNVSFFFHRNYNHRLLRSSSAPLQQQHGCRSRIFRRNYHATLRDVTMLHSTRVEEHRSCKRSGGIMKLPCQFVNWTLPPEGFLDTSLPVVLFVFTR